MMPAILSAGINAGRTFNPFTAQLSGGAAAGTSKMDVEQLIERLLQAMEKRDSDGMDTEDVRRLSFASDPRGARQTESFLREQRRKDTAERSQPGRVVQSYIRGGSSRPDMNTFKKAGITPEDAERQIAARKGRAYDRNIKQKTDRLADAQTQEERERLQKRIDELLGKRNALGL